MRKRQVGMQIRHNTRRICRMQIRHNTKRRVFILSFVTCLILFLTLHYVGFASYFVAFPALERSASFAWSCSGKSYGSDWGKIFPHYKSPFLLKHIEWNETRATNLSKYIHKNLLLEKSELRQNDKLLDLDLEKVEKKLTQIPWLDQVQFQKKLPSTLVINFTPHHAKAFALKNQKIWLISESGKWISEGNPEQLPFLVNPQTIQEELQWVQALESIHSIFQVHEVSFSLEQKKLRALVELTYTSQTAKIWITALGLPHQTSLDQLEQVSQYLIKHNLFIHNLDMRFSQKIVVNVAKHP